MPSDRSAIALLRSQPVALERHGHAPRAAARPGVSSPLEVGNPPTDWFSVSYNTSINRYIMAILTHVRSDTTNYELDLTASEDGYEWSPRVPLLDFHGEMAYPTIVDPNGDPFNTAATFYIYYVTTPLGVTRWHNTAFKRLTVTLSGQMLEPPHGWEFDADPEGWKPLNQMETFDVHDGVLTIEASGPDPYMLSPTVGVSTGTYKHIEVRMKVGQSGTGEFFFTTSETPNISGETSVRFPVTASDDFQTYTVDMSKKAAWKGRIGDLRFDPIDVKTAIEIDYIRLVP